jgi:signal transduction histidine kinase
VSLHKATWNTAGPWILLAVVTAMFALDGGEEPSALRHLYLVPPLWAALSCGSRAGSVVGLVAGLLQAPFALPAVERLGLRAQSIDGLVSMVMPVAFGWVVGSLVDQSRDQARRLQAVLDLQRGLGSDGALEQRLRLAVERVRAVLGAQRAALVVDDEATRVVASAPAGCWLIEQSAVGWALREGQSVFARDVGRDTRFIAAPEGGPTPIRGLILPLDSGKGPIGALAIERAGELPSSTRSAACEIALHLALAVENARLTVRQRRFAEELEAKVIEATERLRQLDCAKTEFVSVVAHELRTPLTALQGFTELLLSRAVPPERAARFLDHLHDEARRLSRIVGELLDLSRIEAGRPLELRWESVDLPKALDRTIERFAIQHRQHRFQVIPHPGAPTLHADRDAVDRILNNLISNAVKYSPAGGRVIVAARPAEDRPGMVELSVEDDGVGIAGDDLSRIFEKYVRVPDPATTAVRGLGLGLALVRALAEAHGGAVEVESKPGKGSKFRIFLPGQSPVLAYFPNSSA